MKYSFVLLGCYTIVPALAGSQIHYPRTSDLSHSLHRRASPPGSPRGSASSSQAPIQGRPLKAKVKATGPGAIGGFEMGRRLSGITSTQLAPGQYNVQRFSDPMEVMAGGKSEGTAHASQGNHHIFMASSKGPHARGQVMAPLGGSGYVNIKTPTQEQRFDVAGGEARYFRGMTSPDKDVKVHAGVSAGGLVSASAHNRVQPGQPDTIGEDNERLL